MLLKKRCQNQMLEIATNRDWKRITHTKIGVFRISIHVALLFCLLQRLDAQQTNKKCTIA